MCDPLGWIPTLPKGMTMPPGYDLHAACGMDGGRAVYCWSSRNPWRFGPNELDKRKAVRQAWRVYRGMAKPGDIED